MMGEREPQTPHWNYRVKAKGSDPKTYTRKMAGKDTLFLLYGCGRAEIPGTGLLRRALPVLLSLGCSISSAQIEPNAGNWKTWVLTSGDQMRLPPPPDEAETRAEIAQLKVIAKQRDAATLDRIIWWNAGPPGYRWTSIAIPSGPANATLHSRIMACRWQFMTQL
jgi:hypothetical protein